MDSGVNIVVDSILKISENRTFLTEKEKLLKELKQSIKPENKDIENERKLILKQEKELVSRRDTLLEKLEKQILDDETFAERFSKIKQALEDAPSQKDVVIRLNPKDYAQIEQLTRESEANLAKGVTFVADAGIGPAQCLLETPKGIVESIIDEHLERISEALKKAG